ncbi:MAG: class I SAM-dependent rRNA methyltransferase [Alphaproteobacteria bacterium]|nr:class I SAM-dependent rRNA methyltransferase [Alphaproteobacteria bacterium]
MTEIDIPAERPTLRLMPGRAKRLRQGHPWAFSNELAMTPEIKALPPGTLVTVMDAGGEKLGVATFNPHSLIALRILDRDAGRAIDQSFFADRLGRAMALRDLLWDSGHYRLAFSEADGLPGLVVDRYGPVVAVQANSAGMERLTPLAVAALGELLAPRAVVLRNDSPVRGLEGLDSYVRVALGDLDEPVEIVENGARFLADLGEGQKTGWFHDQRDNRAFAASLARGRSVIDFYTHSGGFAIQAALAGATMVTAVDRSESSLALAARSAALNGVEGVCRFVKAEAFGEMARLAQAGERFGLVIADPPAFVKSKKDLAAGARGYRKMTRMAAALVEPGGFLLVASCSHHVTPEAFGEEVRHGLAAAGRNGRILRAAGAAPDHPVHPFLPESAYLKVEALQLD